MNSAEISGFVPKKPVKAFNRAPANTGSSSQTNREVNLMRKSILLMVAVITAAVVMASGNQATAT